MFKSINGDRLLIKTVKKNMTTRGGLQLPNGIKLEYEIGEVVMAGKKDDGSELSFQPGDRIAYMDLQCVSMQIEQEDHRIISTSAVLGVLS